MSATIEKDYDEVTADHYAAYRPPLHKPILQQALKDEKFGTGLDVGSGTGHSTQALLNFCDKVYGVEASDEMRLKVYKSKNIEYLNFDGQQLDFEDGMFNIVTFAGSLYYVKSEKLLNELIRVCSNRAMVIVYDFKVDLSSILSHFGVSEIGESNYNHKVDLDDLCLQNLTKLDFAGQEISLNMDATDLAHLILSERKNREMLKRKFVESDLYERLSSFLISLKGENLQTSVRSFWSSYRVSV